jgi:hypothetical protein
MDPPRTRPINGDEARLHSPFRTVTISLVNGDTNHVQVTDSLDPATSDYKPDRGRSHILTLLGSKAMACRRRSHGRA